MQRALLKLLTLLILEQFVRAVERGSSIVAVVRKGSRVVLQMPRGNLETVNPRPLVLAEARNMLEQKLFLQVSKLNVLILVIYSSS